jgi:hypothetical protein
MTPWLLLIIAALIVVSVSLYSYARQVESQTLGQQLVVADELREAEAALLAALDKVRQMETALAVRERNLARDEVSTTGGRLPETDRWTCASHRSVEEKQVERHSTTRSTEPASGSTLLLRAERAAGSEPAGTAQRSIVRPECHKEKEASIRLWQARALELAETGITAAQIACELELPVGEVELVLALRIPPPPLL